MSERRVYVFLIKRKQDKQAWPVAWEDLALAVNEPYRVSDVVEVVLQEMEARL